MSTRSATGLIVIAALAHACGADGPTAARSAAAASRCDTSASKIACPHESLTLAGRSVAYAVPLGDPPSGGWPAIIYFQPTGVPGDAAFAATADAAWNQYDLTRTVAALLDGGYAVVAPNAEKDGTGAWETNAAQYAQSWAGSPDDLLMQALFSALAAGRFGPIDSAHLYAMGISSGGFMTSRMAVSYPGRFRALVNHSGTYATCVATCTVPRPLPADHPPTLFLHGDEDSVVPLAVVQPYVDALEAEGHEAKLVRDAHAGHQWLPEGPQLIPAWFQSHR